MSALSGTIDSGSIGFAVPSSGFIDSASILNYYYYVYKDIPASG